MKNLLLIVCAVLLFLSCGNSNPIIGRWVTSESEEVFKGGNVGAVLTMTFNPDGTLEEKFEFQVGAKDKNFGNEVIMVGKWQMPTDDKLIVHFEKAIIDGEEKDSDNDEVEFTIIKLDGDNLEMMKGGKEVKLRRK